MSHNTFNAFFSGTDLADETASRYYGVYGFLQKEEDHEFVLRVAAHGQSLDLTVEDLYDLQDTDETPYMFDFEAVASNVIEQPVTAVDPAIYTGEEAVLDYNTWISRRKYPFTVKGWLAQQLENPLLGELKA